MAEDNDGDRNAVVERTRTDAPLFQGRQLSKNAAEGVIDIESQRAIAQAQAQFVVALRAPRDEILAAQKFKEACSRRSFAEGAFYSYTRGGETISGPSIRFAEEAARHWRNLDYGLNELAQGPDYSEMEVYCIDLEANVRSRQTFTVRHVRDTRAGGKQLTEQRDKYEITANMGARRLRARILAVLPEDYVDDAVEVCKKTLAGAGGRPLPDRIKTMIQAFESVGVPMALLERRMGHPAKDTTPQEIITYQGIYHALKDGVTTVEAEFPMESPASAEGAPKASATAPSEGRRRGTAAKSEPEAENAASPPASDAPAAAEEPPAVQEPPAAEGRPEPSLSPPEETEDAF